MAFWVRVKLEPEQPYTHGYNSSHSEGSVFLGNMSPVSSCQLHANNASCTLDIEFEEKEDDVVFEVIGSRSVHLTGFYLGHNGQSGTGKVRNYGSGSASQVAEVKKDFEYKDTVVNGRHVRTMASGLVIEDIETSKNRQIAYHGCGYISLSLCIRVCFHYFAQIKSTGYVFESNYATPWKNCRGDLIKGLEDGINDKRRLTIPPSMGYYGSKARRDVPADVWVVCEVDLENVKD
ncbi:hypothetical protein MKW92_042745 [Papaver armeniacum]|nr:hypothetical protein MKW92_042745 [Papaver armeniacum]